MGEREEFPCPSLIQIQKQVEKHGEAIHMNDLACAEIKIELGVIKSDTTEIKDDVKSIKEKPGKRWDGIVTNISNWVIIAILAYIANNIGLQ